MGQMWVMRLKRLVELKSSRGFVARLRGGLDLDGKGAIKGWSQLLSRHCQIARSEDLWLIDW